MVKLVIFDFDGTLVESESLAADIHARQLTGLGLNMTPAEVIYHFTGVTSEIMTEKLSREFGLEISNDFFTHYENEMAKRAPAELKITPGTRQTLDDLQHPYCLASNSSRDWIMSGLAATSLHAHFEGKVYPTSLVANGKPAPDIFLHIADLHHVEPKDCLVVEDSLSGVTGAVAAGCQTVGFVGGGHIAPGHSDKLRDLGARHLISDMRELLTHLEKAS